MGDDTTCNEERERERERERVSECECVCIQRERKHRCIITMGCTLTIINNYLIMPSHIRARKADWWTAIFGSLGPLVRNNEFGTINLIHQTAKSKLSCSSTYFGVCFGSDLL